MKPFIEENWKEYQDAVIHPLSPPEQIKDLRMCFFGGMQIIIHELAKIPENQRLRRMAQIQDELLTWFRDFKKDVGAQDPFSDN